MFMKLGKLLGMGKSFFGNDPAAEYRLNRRACLPKFNDGKNPFAPKGASTEDAPAPKPEPQGSAPIPPAPKAPAPYAFKPVPKPEAKAAARAVLQVAAKPVRPGWATRLNPFRAPEPAPPPAAVQEELSLDAVKVVHNDLADADVDMVPVKSHTAPVAVPVLAPARQAWEYMGENLLKSS